MLTFMMIWIGLILLCLPIGISILNITNATCFNRLGDRFILGTWLGIIALSISLLAVALFVPLSPIVGATIAVLLLSISLSLKKARVEIMLLGSTFSPVKIFGFTVLALGVALFSTASVTWYDAGLYHFQIIQWISKVGLVPGLGLIHNRFGFTSSWFALAAPFNTGIFEARMSAVTGGFALLLISLHFWISLLHTLRHQSRHQDWLIIFSLFFYFPFIFRQKLVMSSSPDIPVIVLTILTAWSIVSISNQPKEYAERLSYVDNGLIPIILSAGAFTMKLSAAPILFISILFYTLYNEVHLKRLLLGILISVAIIIPTLCAGMITTGCSLYPSTFLCLDIPWSVGKDEAHSNSELIRNWARWSGEIPPDPDNLKWILHWVKIERPAAFLIFCSFMSIIAIFRARLKTIVNGKSYVLGIGILGIYYMMYAAPSLRFGLGYLCIIPAFAMALYIDNNFQSIINLLILVMVMMNFVLDPIDYRWTIFFILILVCLDFFAINTPKTNQKPNRSFYLVSCLLLVTFSPLLLSSYYYIGVGNIFLPPKMEQLQGEAILYKQNKDVKYFTPAKGDQCWATNLPCTPYLTHADIKLRIHKRGIAGGFVRSNLID